MPSTSHTLPSPPLSDNESEQSPLGYLPQDAYPLVVGIAPTKKSRKHNLSDAESDLQTKRQRRAQGTPPAVPVILPRPTKLLDDVNGQTLQTSDLDTMPSLNLFQLPTEGLFETAPFNGPVDISISNDWSDVGDMNLTGMLPAFFDGMFTFNTHVEIELTGSLI
jgi:hypothetical protein